MIGPYVDQLERGGLTRARMNGIMEAVVQCDQSAPQ
jgi:hypothetical protein